MVYMLLNQGVPVPTCSACKGFLPNHKPSCAGAGYRTTDARAELEKTESGRALLRGQADRSIGSAVRALEDGLDSDQLAKVIYPLRVSSLLTSIPKDKVKF